MFKCANIIINLFGPLLYNLIYVYCGAFTSNFLKASIFTADLRAQKLYTVGNY